GPVSGCHQTRARVCSAVTGRSPAIAPLDGPAPIPSPHVGKDRENFATPCAAAVEPLSLRPVPASVRSTLKRTARTSGGLTSERPVNPWPAQDRKGRGLN